MATDPNRAQPGEPTGSAAPDRAREPIAEFLIGISAVAAVVGIVWAGIALVG